MEGIEYREERQEGIPVDYTRIYTEEAARRLDRPCGEYITVHTGRLKKLKDLYQVGECLVIYLRQYLEKFAGKNILVAGIGNRDILGDNIGPATAQRFSAAPPKIISKEPLFGNIGVLAPGTFGQTNLETSSLIAGVARTHDISCVILIDSCTTVCFDRLVSSIQISTTGMYLHRSRACQFDAETIGAPVIAICVPTVMDVSKFIDSESDKPEMIMRCGIEDDVTNAATIIAYALARVSCPDVSQEMIQLAQRVLL